MKKHQAIAVVMLVSSVLFLTLALEAQTTSLSDEATFVRPGEITPRQREFSKEYQQSYSSLQRKKLGSIADVGKMRGGAGEIGVSIGLPSIPSFGGQQPTAIEVMTDLSCQSDAIVRGVPQRKTAYLTEDESFVYTEYDFSVKEVLKNNRLSPIESGTDIQITRPGGLIKLNGQLIRVDDQSYQSLEINGEYLLFLKYIPSAKGFIVADAGGDFRLNGNSFSSLSRRGILAELRSGKSENLLEIIQAASAVSCQNRVSEFRIPNDPLF
jgi:hypothetical protein